MKKVKHYQTDKELLNEYKKQVLFGVFFLLPFLYCMLLFVLLFRLIKFTLGLFIPVEIKFVEEKEEI